MNHDSLIWKKKLTSKLVVLHFQKELQVLEKKFILKNNSSSGNFLKINGSQNILNFGEFMVPKILFHNKIISKKLLTTMAYTF